MRYAAGYVIAETNHQETEQGIKRLKETLDHADSVLIGAGAGLSTAAGFTYSGPRFEKLFSDFAAKYPARDMYSLGFANFENLEEQWGFWSRYIMCNRYEDAPKDTYNRLLELVADKDYFVLTTNVDHQFQRVGFNKQRLFYTQGDYGLWQCSVPCHSKTYDNEEQVRRMCAEQENLRIPTQLIPYCPVCGKPMSMNLRADNTFVEDEGWHEAAARYGAWVDAHKNGTMCLLELGVGGNTPVIIKYPFWRYALDNPQVTYACVNLGEAVAPEQIDKQSILINADIHEVLCQL